MDLVTARFNRFPLHPPQVHINIPTSPSAAFRYFISGGGRALRAQLSGRVFCPTTQTALTKETVRYQVIQSTLIPVQDSFLCEKVPNKVQHLISAKCWTNTSDFPHFQFVTFLHGGCLYSLFLGERMQMMGEGANCAWALAAFLPSFPALLPVWDTYTCTEIMSNAVLAWIIDNGCSQPSIK